MANFFDDDDDINDTLRQESIHRPAAAAAAAHPNPPRAGPSRSRSRSRSRSASGSPDLPPPLRQQQQQQQQQREDPRAYENANINLNAKGKARESSRQGNGNVNDNGLGNAQRATYGAGGGGAGGGQRRQHARATSEFSMDLDDTNAQQRNRRAGAAGALDADNGDDNNEEKEESDVQRLTRLYMDERQAPELLHFPEELVDTLMQNLEAQSEAASVLISSGLSAEPDQHERLLLVQMEIERVRWLLRSYLRTRTYKIEKQATYLLRTPLAKAKMSDVERGYAERYLALVQRHFQSAVTQNIPERLGRLDEEEMVVRPELDQAVFAKARKDCPPIRMPDGQMLEMRKGEIHLVRYRTIRRLLRDGDVRLV